jgi:hypothetical protein
MAGPGLRSGKSVCTAEAGFGDHDRDACLINRNVVGAFIKIVTRRIAGRRSL